MSTNLIYDKQFIKVEKDNKVVFLPIIYCGSSNCFEIGRNGRSGRRSREWWLDTYILNGKRYGTLEEMLARTEEIRAELIEHNKESIKEYGESWGEYSDKQFGYYDGLSIGGSRTIRTTFGMFKGLYKTGCEKALTVEELRELGVSVNIHSTIWDKEKRAEFEQAGQKDIYCYPTTSKELIEKIDEFETYLKDYPYVSLYVDINADEYKMKRIRRAKFPKKNISKTLTEVDKYYVVEDTTSGHYILKSIRNGYTYPYYKFDAKKFLKEAEAKRYAKKLQEKMPNRKFEVELVNEKTKVYA